MQVIKYKVDNKRYMYFQQKNKELQEFVNTLPEGELERCTTYHNAENTQKPEHLDALITKTLATGGFDWMFHPYTAHREYFPITLRIFEGCISDIFDLTKKIQDKLSKYCDGCLIESSEHYIQFKVYSFEELLEVITTSTFECVNHGLKHSGFVSRTYAFPSVEYANDYIQHALKRATTLQEIEGLMRHSAGLSTELQEELDYEVPLMTNIQFDPQNSTDIEALLDRIGERLQVISTGVNSCVSRMQQLKNDVSSSEEVSEEYKQFQSMWL